MDLLRLQASSFLSVERTHLQVDPFTSPPTKCKQRNGFRARIRQVLGKLLARYLLSGSRMTIPRPSPIRRFLQTYDEAGNLELIAGWWISFRRRWRQLLSWTSFAPDYFPPRSDSPADYVTFNFGSVENMGTCFWHMAAENVSKTYIYG